MYKTVLHSLLATFFLSICAFSNAQPLEQPTILQQQVGPNVAKYKIQYEDGSIYRCKAKKLNGNKTAFIILHELINDTIFVAGIKNNKIRLKPPFVYTTNVDYRPLYFIVSATPWVIVDNQTRLTVDITEDNCYCLDECELCVECLITTGGGNCPQPGDDIELRLSDHRCFTECLNSQ